MNTLPENDPPLIAIVGMACRFPGAKSTEEYWSLLSEGREALTELTDQELREAGVAEADLQSSNYVKKGMFLDDMELFDREFFGFSPRESAILDPQHRHFLELGWAALEHSGIVPGQTDDAIGVFAGSGQNSYYFTNLLSNPDLVDETGEFLLRHTGNDKDFLTTRLSYLLNLKGPSVNVATACSTSLVAVHMACQSLLAGECDVALAGGVTIVNPHRTGYMYKEGEILSRDGHCRPFDNSASGTIFGNGGGVVALRRLEEAVENKDNILAVIRGSAVNNDGEGKVSYLAPSVEGQAACIAEALDIADLSADSISYVETHGTGTAIGDPIEVAALSQAFSEHTEKTGYCGLGSVKSNIGHTDTAAGIASLIKVVLSMQHRQLPATLNFKQPNRAIDFPNTPFYVNDKLVDWVSESPLRAGVSSLGVGGTNAHLIVEEAPRVVTPSVISAAEDAGGLGLYVLSAKSHTALVDSADNLAEYLDQASSNASLELSSLEATLQLRRQAMPYRSYVVGSDAQDIARQLRKTADVRNITPAGDTPRDVCFLFAGGGAQYPGMGQELYEQYAVYRDVVDECLTILDQHLDYDLRSLLYPAQGQMETAAEQLRRPSRSIPSLFVTQYAQAQLWLSWGVAPAGFLGHSMGEVTAACVAGVFDLPGALGLIALRGQLFEQTEKGGMLNVALPVLELQQLLLPGLSIASVNSPDSCVASGSVDIIAKFEEQLTQANIQCARVFIDVAAHSPLLDPILPQFKAYLEGIKLNPPNIPFVSNLSSEWITAAQTTSPQYWVDHMRNTVQFADCATTLLNNKDSICLEVGPGRTLAGLTAANVPSAKTFIFESMPAADIVDVSSKEQMLNTFGMLWQKHATVSWAERFSGDEQNLALPTYPFQGKWCWQTPGVVTSGSTQTGTDYEAPNAWFHQPVWHQHPLAPTNKELQSFGTTLILAFPEQLALAEELVSLQRKRNDSTWLIHVDGTSDLNREAKTAGTAVDDTTQLQQILQTATAEMPLTNVYCLFAEADSFTVQPGVVEKNLSLLVNVAKLLMELPDQSALSLALVTRQAFQVAAETVDAAQSAIAGAARVIPKELPNVTTIHVDLDANNNPMVAREAAAIIAETDRTPTSSTKTQTVALRSNLRFVASYERLDKEQLQEQEPPAAGTYLVTGGIGGLGLAAAKTLAAPGVHLILANRSEFIEPDRWDETVARYGLNHTLGQKIQRLQEIQALGASIETIVLDVTDVDALQQLFTKADEQNRRLRGIVHAAGALNDGLLALKTPESIANVLSPKVAGSVALQAAIGNRRLDFMVLYSSISSEYGLVGQVDYAAANAFLNGFALQLSAIAPYPVTSILWPAWQDIGMAAERERGLLYRKPATGHRVEHPMLDAKKSTVATDLRYLSTFSTAQDWVVSEHRLHDGSSLMPGSGYLELALATFRDITGEQNATFREVNFFAPCFVSDDEEIELQIEFEAMPTSGYRFTVSDAEGSKLETAEYCTGYMTPLENSQGAPKALDVSSIRNRCDKATHVYDDPEHHPLLQFGDRWRALQKVNAGVNEALIDFSLPAHYADDMQHYDMHPAIVDMATAGAQLITQHTNTTEIMLVPMAYQEIRVHKPVPMVGVSHVRLSTADSNDDHAGDIVIFNVDLCDQNGNICVEFRDFLMRPIEPSTLQGSASEAPLFEVDSALSEVIALGISEAEGSEALSLALGSAIPSQIMILPRSPAETEDKLGNIGGSSNAVAAATVNQDSAEFDEVAEALNGSQWVEDSVVRQYGRGEKTHVVAHILLRSGENATVSELRRYLKERVRVDLVPAHYQFVDKFTYSAAGAINRTLLADPVVDDSYVAPRTVTEKTLSAIWGDILGTSRIGVHDNFFDIGGHSLLSIRAIVTMEKQTGVRLNQKTMVLQSLEQVAAEVDGAAGTSTPSADPKEKGLFQRLLGR